MVPFLALLSEVRDTCYKDNARISEAEFKDVIECAKNPLEAVVLKNFKARQRGRAPHGELTLEDADERAKRQKRKVPPDAERVKQ